MPANNGLACPPQLKSIDTIRRFLVYIPANRVTESIHFRRVEKERKKRRKIQAFTGFAPGIPLKTYRALRCPRATSRYTEMLACHQHPGDP